MRVEVPLRRCYRLINHGPTTLITSAAGGRRNIMAAAWVMPLDFEPARIAAVISEGTLTRELVDRSGVFVVNLPTVAMAAAAHAVGGVSGHREDKFATLGIETSPASAVEAPFVEGCVGWLECRVVPDPTTEQRYDLFVADVLAAWADDTVFKDGRWHFSDLARRTIHHVAGGAFFATGDEIGDIPLFRAKP